MTTKPKKYTETFVTKEVEKILNIIIKNKKIIYIGEVFEKLPYSRQRFSQWSNEFKRNKKIPDTIKRIKEILETRINVGGLKNKLNATMSIFNLKVNYNWDDKREESNKMTTVLLPSELLKKNKLN